MDHGALVTHGHAAADGKRAREKLDDESLHLEDILDPSAVEEANDFWNSGPCSSRLVYNKQ